MPQIDTVWPETNDELHVLVEGNNIWVRSADNTGSSRSVILDESFLPGTNHKLRVFQAGTDLEYIPNACIDPNGNVYNAVRIGSGANSITMITENLMTSKYVDGTNIVYPGSWSSYKSTTIPYRYPKTISSDYPSTRVYNWKVVDEASSHGGLISGWHVPSYSEMANLHNILTGNIAFSTDVATATSIGRCISSKEGWSDASGSVIGKNPHINNITGLNLMPYGAFVSNGEPYMTAPFAAGFWTSTSNSSDDSKARVARINYTADVFYWDSFSYAKEDAFPIRLVKD